MTQRLTMLSMFAASLIGLAYFATSFAQESQPDNWNSLEIQYAEANLKLAEAQLATAQHTNQQAADSVSKATIDSLRAGVAIAQDRLKNLQGTGDENPYSEMILEAEARLRGAEEAYQESLQANGIDASAVPEVKLRKQQAEIEVAQARLAMLKSLDAQPADVRLHWEIRQLQDEIRALWNRPLIED